MKQLLSLFAISILIPLAGCHSKRKRDTSNVPPLGYYDTRAAAQTDADRANADIAKTRAAEKAAGVRDQDLPCGEYKVVSRADSDGHSWWGTQRDMTGCPNVGSFLHQPKSKAGGSNP